MKKAISGIVICRNEEKVIARCLSSLLWVDELIVVDAMSSDRTAEICKDPKAPWASKIRFFQRQWDHFNNQRNFALDQCRYDWVFSLDADEVCSKELAERIQSVLRQDGPCRYYKVKRNEYFMGRLIRWGIWNPSYQDRFFDRRGIRYVNEIHEYPVYPSTPERIDEPIEHLSDLTMEKFFTKMNHYTSIEAKNRFDQGIRTNLFRVFLSGPAMFLKNYFYYKAYRDGVEGFIISVMEAVSRTVRHLKLWELAKAQSKSIQGS
jgi:glycosyltransferase involved in cell wall biosynthesis